MNVSTRSKAATSATDTDAENSQDVTEAVKQGTEVSNADIMAMLKTIESKQDSFQTQLTNLRTEMLQLMDKKIEAATEKISKDVSEVQDNLTKVQQDIKKLQSDANNAMSRPVDDPVNDPDRTLIIINLKADHDDESTLPNKVEDILKILSPEIEENINVVQVKRIPSRNQKPGLVKVAMDSKASKIAVLRAKSLLKDSEKYSKVYLRSSKTHAERLIEINFKKMLDIIPNGSQYRVTGNGRVEEKTEDGYQTTNTRGRGGYSRGSLRGPSRGLTRGSTRGQRQFGLGQIEDSVSGLTPV